MFKPRSSRRTTRRLIAILTSTAAFFLPAALAHGATLEVATGGSDDGDCIASPCATIGYAIFAAEPNDTIDIAAGSYDEQLTIAKPLTIQGASDAATTIGPSEQTGIVAGTIVTLADGADGTTLRDLAVRSRAQYEAAIATSGTAVDNIVLDEVEVAGIGPSTPPTTVAAGLEISVPAANWTIAGGVFEANYHGILVSADVAGMTIEESLFADNRNGLYVARSTPLGPDSTGTIDELELRDSLFAENEYRGLYFEGLGDAVIDGVEVVRTGRGIDSLPFGGRGLAVNLKAGDFGEIVVSNSSVAGSDDEGISLQVRGYPGDASYEAAPATLESFRLTGSAIVGNGGPGIAVDNQANIGSVAIAASRIVGNGVLGSGTAPASGVFAWNTEPGAPLVAAEGNWFGCNGGPAAAPCDTVNQAVDASPWIVAEATAEQSSVAPGGQSTIRATLDTDSAGQPAAPIAAPIPVSFSASSGSMAPQIVPLSDGSAASVFTAPAQPGEVTVSVGVDEELLSVPVSVPAPPVEEPPPPPAPSPEPPAPSPAAPPPPAAVEPSGNGAPKPVSGGGQVTVATVSCAAASCEVAARKPQVQIGGRSYKLKVKLPASLGAGDTASVRVVLPRKAREALAAKGRGKVKLTLTVTASDGTTQTVRVTLTVRKPGKQRVR